jgi:outer membrane protein TolC
MSQSKKRALLAIILFLFSFSVPVLAEEDEITLDQAREYFYCRNFDILINQYEISKAQADLRGAKLLPNPTLSANYTGLETSGLQKGDNTQLTYRIDQLIELGGKR